MIPASVKRRWAKISADKDWSEDDYRLLFHLAENFENNYHEHEGQLPVSAEEGNERFFEAFAMLPPSPEKHEMMKLMLSNFADRQLSIDGEIEMLSEDFISLAEEMQAEKYDLLEDFVGSGMELYPELRRLGQEKLAGGYQLLGQRQLCYSVLYGVDVGSRFL